MPRKPREFIIEHVMHCRWCDTDLLFDHDPFNRLADHVLAQHPDSFDEFVKGVVAQQERTLQLLRSFRAAEEEPPGPPPEPAEPEPTVAMDLTEKEATWLKRRRASAARQRKRGLTDD